MGADALTDGYKVTTTIDSRLQQAANLAAWRAILEYDRRHGYRGPAAHLDWRGDQRPGSPRQPSSSAVPVSGDLVPALVRSVGEREAEVQARDGRP